MSEATFTKGPWEAKGLTIYGPHYEHTSIGSGEVHRWRGWSLLGNQWGSKEQREIDVRLIAAAPELYEALDALRSFMWAEGYADQTKEMAMADAALAKATH